jgi:pectate lyase C
MGIAFSFTSSAQEQEVNTADWSKNDKGTIVVKSGIFDGKGQNYGKVGDGSQREDQPPVFELYPGTSLKDVVIVPPAGDGIHVHGDNRVSNVTFIDVGEDAISMRVGFKGGTVIIENSSFSRGADKIFQANIPGVWYIKNCKVNGAGKVFRQNGGTTFKLDIFIDGLEARSYGEAVVRSDASKCTVYYRNLKAGRNLWKGRLKAVKWDGINPPPPTLPSSATKINPPSFTLGDVNNKSKVNITEAILNAQYYVDTDQVQFYDISGRRGTILRSNRSKPAMLYLMKLKGNHGGRVIVNLLK